MATVEFEASAAGPGTIASASPGERLLDVCDASQAPVTFSCRSASCGVCRVEILEGDGELSPPADDEREVLAIFDAGPRERLACQARFAPNAVRVRLRWVGA